MPLERELAAYRRNLPKLLDRQGKFAVYQGDELAGVWDTYADALSAAYERFGLQPFLVKRIEAVEQPLLISRSVEASCRS
jgi:hypothetical protein